VATASSDAQRPAWKRALVILGPGLITGAADDDPSGISTYSVTGATTGFGLMWLLLLTTPMMAVIQGMCARIALVTGEGLAAIMRKKLPRTIAYALAAIVIIANTFNLGADLGGMAASASMLVPVPAIAWTISFGIALVAAQVWFSYGLLERIFKWLTLTLFAYVVTAFVVHPPWITVLWRFLVPHFSFDKNTLSTMVAVLGTTITPYLFFWQAALAIEDEKKAGQASIKKRRGTDVESICDCHMDINTGMIYSNAVAFFIIVTTAATLGAAGKHDIATAQQAAQALVPLAGKFAALLFTAGMVGTGILAVPVLAGSSAYVFSETFRFREGLNEKPKRAPQFYAIIILGMLVGVLMNVFHLDAIRALFWSAILNGVAAVPLLAAIVWLASDKKMMREWRSSPIARAWGWATFALMAAASAGMFFFMAKGQ
jgi:NRAMP (natural resistance-associated macrophage protein)-like metal ion transporter